VPTIEERIIIGQPAERIFARLAQPERAPEWTPNLVRVQRTSQIESGLGVETRVEARVGGRTSRGTGRCIAWDPPRSLSLESKLDVGVSSTTTFSLVERAAATELTARVDYTLPTSGLGRLLGGLIGEPMLRRDMRTALGTLKQQLEAEGQS
jgi:uncharacterized protein YndB with AHSA1/START domain